MSTLASTSSLMERTATFIIEASRIAMEGDQLRSEGLAGVGGMSPSKPWYSATGIIVRTGCTSFPDENPANP
jgi:hypothetical protein